MSLDYTDNSAALSSSSPVHMTYEEGADVLQSQGTVLCLDILTFFTRHVLFFILPECRVSFYSVTGLCICFSLTATVLL
jgi:hypothetical protein